MREIVRRHVIKTGRLSQHLGVGPTAVSPKQSLSRRGRAAPFASFPRRAGNIGVSDTPFPTSSDPGPRKPAAGRALTVATSWAVRSPAWFNFTFDFLGVFAWFPEISAGGRLAARTSRNESREKRKSEAIVFPLGCALLEEKGDRAYSRGKTVGSRASACFGEYLSGGRPGE